MADKTVNETIPAVPVAKGKYKGVWYVVNNQYVDPFGNVVDPEDAPSIEEVMTPVPQPEPVTK